MFGEKKTKLSIIIPYYKVLNEKLFSTLSPQLTDEVQVIVIDDGCDNKNLDKLPAEVVHLSTNSGTASTPRNVGLDLAKGEYVTFIDADDYVFPNYIEEILNAISTKEFDYCYFGWKAKFGTFMIVDNPPSWNCCVWNCIYKRDIIGNEKFNPALRIAEDYDFNLRVRKGKKANILSILYYYDTDENPTSLTKSN